MCVCALPVQEATQATPAPGQLPHQQEQQQQQEVGLAADSLEMAKLRAELSAAESARDQQLAIQEVETNRIGARHRGLLRALEKLCVCICVCVSKSMCACVCISAHVWCKRIRVCAHVCLLRWVASKDCRLGGGA